MRASEGPGMCVRACVHACWCGTPHYVLLHSFIDVFISVSNDRGKTHVDVVRNQRLLITFISEGGRTSSERRGPPGRLTRRALLSLQMLTVSLIAFPNLKSSFFYAKRMYTILAENNCFHHLQFPSFIASLPVRFSVRRAWLASATFR